MVTEGEKGRHWTSRCLAEAWKSLSLDPITGAEQTSNKYRSRIKNQFNEQKHFNEFKVIHMECTLARRFAMPPC
jgi:predicted secreted protein